MNGVANGSSSRMLLGGAMVATVLLLAALTVAVQRPGFGPKPGVGAPDFSLETFDGHTVKLSDLKGQVVVVNFWASWCKECGQESADLEAIWQEYRNRKVTVLGIDYTDTTPAARDYLAQFGISYPNGPDRADEISRTYQLTGVPETLVIDRAGVVVPLAVRNGAPGGQAKIIGPILPDAPFTPADLRSLLDRLVLE